MGNKDMRSEINQVHQIFATFMGFISVILVFLIKSLTQSNIVFLIKSLTQSNIDTTDLIKLLVYLTPIISFIILVVIVLHIWTNKVISIIDNYKTNTTGTNLLDILLPLSVINIIISIISIVLDYFSLNILLSPESLNEQSLLLSLSALLVLFSLSPVAITIDFVKRYKNQINIIFEKYYEGLLFRCSIICTFNIEIFIVTFFTKLIKNRLIIFIYTIFFLAFGSIIFNLIILFILLHEISSPRNNTVSQKFILLHEISSPENNTVSQNPNKDEPKNSTTNSDPTPYPINKASSSKITLKNNSATLYEINLKYIGIVIASLIVLIFIIICIN